MTTSHSPKVQHIINLRTRAAAVRAVYERAMVRMEPLRHHSAGLVLRARALKSRLSAEELSELRRAWGGA